MKTHTKDFKEQIKNLGRQLDSKLTYTIDGVTKTLTNEDLNSVTPVFQGAILKSVMKQLDIDSNVDIPVGTILRYKFGVLVGDEYEYLDYGNYVVYSSKKQEDYNSYKIVCYDKMLYSMKQNEDLGVTYPISVRDYIDALCTKIGLEFKNKTDVFANYDKMITKELYVGQEYTYRDIFDELSQVTASTICLDIDDKVEIRYINKLTDLQITEGTNITITDSEQDTINSLTLDGRCEQETTTGKNLLENKTKNSGTNKGVTFTLNSDGSYTLNGTNDGTGNSTVFLSSSSQPTTLKAGTYYTIPTPNGVKITGSKIGGGYFQLASSSTNQFTLSEDTQAQIYIQVSNGITTTYNNIKVYPMISKTPITQTDYEPYTGGQPSPSPDYPQEIKTITGNLKLTSCGKNLFDINNLNFENVWVKPTGEKIAANNNGFLSYVEILPNAEYILSLNRSVASIGICEYDKNKNFIQRIVVSNSSSKTIITSTTTKYIGVFINIDGTTLVTKDIIDECEPQLEKSNQATTYEPYQGSSLNITIPENEFVGKLDDTYKDTLKVVYKEDGHYHLILNKMIGKVVLDGSEEWIYNSEKKYFRVNKYTFKKIPLTMTTNNKSQYSQISNYFKLNKNWSGTNSFRDGVETNGEFYPIQDIGYKLAFRNLDFDDLSSWRDWLEKNNIDVYYPLETPYEVDLGIVDEMPNTYKGTTHIFNSVDTNMSVTYVNGYETIDEEFLNDVNVNVAKKYGPINSIVLSRSAESDNVYLQDEKSVQANGLCELKIVDNQIMNWNDRSDYLPDILDKLDGLEYYINDFVSTGIAYLELCDNYKLKVFDNIYNCILLNDELDVTQGLVENIHTDMPMETETDYTKADKTDRRISNVSLIVDKQQKEINALANKIVDISNNASGIGTLNITNGSKGILHKLDIYGTLELPIVGGQLGTSATKAGYSKVGTSLVKASMPYIKPLIVGQFTVNSFKITIKQDDEIYKEYIIDNMKNLYQVGTTHDTFEYLDGKCSITRRIGLNNDGTKYILDTPHVEQLKDLNIEVPEGDYTISVNYNELHLDAEYLTKNEYTDAFAKQVELQSEINVRSDEIELLSKKKVNNDEVIASINLTPEKAQIDANKISLKGKEINLTSDDIEITSNNFKVDKQGNLECKNANVQGKIESKEGNVGGWLISDGSLNNGTNFVRSNGFSNIYTTSDIIILQAYLRGESWAQSIGEDTDLFNFYDVNHDGAVDAIDLLRMKKMIMGVDTQSTQNEEGE